MTTIKIIYNDQQVSSIRVPESETDFFTEADFFSAIYYSTIYDLIRLTHQESITGYEFKKNVDKNANCDYTLKIFFEI